MAPAAIQSLPAPWQELSGDSVAMPLAFSALPPKGRRHVVRQLDRQERDADAGYTVSFFGGIYHYKDGFESQRIDWHNAVSFRDNRSGENYIPERSKQVLRRCQALGYDLAVCSFASNLATQRDVLNSARQLERELTHPFTFAHIVCRKFLKDPPTSRPSITGCVTCKAEEITRTGVAIFIDDQRDLLADVEDLQRGRASQNRCRTLISHRTRPLVQPTNATMCVTWNVVWTQLPSNALLECWNPFC